MNLLRQIFLFESRLECRICFHDFSGELSALATEKGLPLHHTNPYCEAVRSFGSEQYAECLKCDVNRIGELLKNGFPFRKDCHAGFREYVFPIRKFNRIACVMFLGVFRSQERCEWEPPLLPPEREPDEESLFFFGELFADSIRRELERLPEGCPRGERREQIHLWFVHHFRNPDISLADLAESLHLSESRTGQLLRREMKCGFPELLRRFRIECAGEILLNSALPVCRVAELCGFRSANYLHRSFLRHTGLTPEKWRGKSQNRKI